MTESRPLEGKVALVAGASSGIGAGIATALASAGASVSLVARRAEELETVAAKVRAHGVKAVAVQADLTVAGTTEHAFTTTERELGPVDILVNNAAFARTGEIHEVEFRHWDLGVRLNLTVPFELTRLALPGMRARGEGWIVNISSEGGLVLAESTSPYAITKCALNRMTEVVDLENRHLGVRAVSICPGWVRTDLAVDPAVFGVPEEELLAPKDIADVVLWVVTRADGIGIGPIIPVRPTSRNAQSALNWGRFVREVKQPRMNAAAAANGANR